MNDHLYYTADESIVVPVASGVIGGTILVLVALITIFCVLKQRGELLVCPGYY